MAARVAPEGVPPLADDDGADVGERQLPADRLPGDRLLLRAEGPGRRPEEPRRGRSRAARDLREARHPAARAEACSPASRSTPSSTASRSRRPSRTSSPSWASSSARSREAVREHPELVQEVPRLRRARRPTTSSPRSTPPSSRDGSFVYIPKGVRCPMELSTYFRINAAEHRPVRAHADRRRGGRATSATSRAAPRRCATRTSCTPPSSSSSRSTTPRSSTRRSRTGTRATRTARAASTTSSPSAARAAGAQLEDLLDPGRDRLGDHLEVPELHPAGRRLGRRVLLGRADQQPPAGRHRHEDDPHRQEHEAARSSRRASRPATGQNTYRGLVKVLQGRRRTRATTPSATRC